MAGQQIGERYFPALSIFHRDRYYGHDQLLELWQDEGPIRLNAVDKNQNPVYAGWIGPNVESMGDSAFYNTTTPGPYTLGVHRTYQAPDPDNPGQTMQQTDSIVVKVVVKPGTGVPDIKDALAALVREVFREKQESITDSLVALRGDSTEVVEEVLAYENSRTSALPVFPVENKGDGEIASSFFLEENPEPQTQGDYTFGDVYEMENNKEYIDAKLKSFNNFLVLARLFQIEQFLYRIIEDPENLDLFLDQLLLNSGTILAQFTLNALSGNERQQIKTMIANYINQQIENLPYE